MFKYLGQHIFDFVSKFRNDVYFQNLEELDQNFSIVVGPDGKLSKSKSPAEKSIIEVRNDEGSVIPAGAPLYSRGEIGGSDRIKVGICDASDPAKMPCIGIAQAEMNTSDTKDNFAITQGVYNTNISGFTGLSEGDTLYVNGGSAPYLTSTKPSNGNYIQNVGIVLKTNGTICQGLLVSAIGRTNDVPWPLYVDVPNSRVGIGTTSPSTALHVISKSSGDGITISTSQDISVAKLYNTNSESFPVGALSLQYGSNNAGLISGQSNRLNIRGGGSSGGSISFASHTIEMMRLTSTGLGIGTTSPSEKLDVNGDIKATRIYSNVFRGYTYSNNWVLLSEVNASTSNLTIGNATVSELIFNGRSDGNMLFKFAGTEKIRFTNDGKLGIGTTSPSQKLHVEGTSIFVGQGTWPMRMENNVASGNAEMGLWTVTDAYAQNEHFSLVATPHPNDSSRPIWYFQASGDGWRDITLQRYGGRVGIRTLTPNANLTVQGHGTTTGKTFLAQDSNASALFTILDSGDVGVGTTSPAAKLDVHGTISQTVDGATNQYPLSFYNSHAGTNFYLLRQRVVNTGNQVRTGLGVTGVPSCAFELGTKTDQILRFTTSGTISNVSTINGNNPLKINATEIRTGDTSGSIGANFNIVGDNNRVPLGIKQESGASQDRFITFRNSSNTEVLGIATTGGFTVTDSNLVKRFEFGHGYSPSPADGMGIGLDLKTEDASGNITSVGFIDVIQDDVSADESSMRISVGETTPTEVMRLQSDGNVGIGTTSPTEKLDVSGNIKASGTIKGKMEQMFACSFADDLGTTKHYLPFTSNAEQTNVHADQAAMVMPYNGRVKSIQMRLSNIDAAGDRTFSIETIAPGINMYASSGLWTTEETETYTLAASDDYYLVNYVFANSQHFSSGDLLAISIQDSADLYTASRQTYITVIVEYDLNNGMGNDTATTKYTS